MVRDRDAKFTSSSYGLLASPGVKTTHAPARSPRGNAFPDRFLHTARSECLDWLLIRSADHLEHKLERRIPIRTQPYNEHRLSPATPLVAHLVTDPRAFATVASSTSPTRVAPISLVSVAPITGSGCPYGRGDAAETGSALGRARSAPSPCTSRLAPMRASRHNRDARHARPGSLQTTAARTRRGSRPRCRRPCPGGTARTARRPDATRVRRSPRRGPQIEARIAGSDRLPAPLGSSGVCC
jgi:hypothetical protein